MASKATMWGLGGLGVKELAKRVWSEVQEDDVFGRAAQLSYYFLLALFPLLLFLTSLMGFIAGEDSELRADLFKYLGAVLPGEASDLISKTVTDVTSGAGGGKLSFGILATLWAASNGMGAISETLNVAYEVKETRPWWKTRVVAVGLTVSLAVLILVALVLVLSGGQIAEWLNVSFGLGHSFEYAWKVLQWPVVLAFVLLAFALIYYFAPDLHEQDWQWVTPGSIVGVVLWLVVSFAFRLYLEFFNSYSATYGSLGAVIVLMLWFYFTGIAILVGGEINSEVENAMAEAGDPEAKEKGEKAPDEKEQATGKKGQAGDSKEPAESKSRQTSPASSDGRKEIAPSHARANSARKRAGDSADNSLSFRKLAVVLGAWAFSKVGRKRSK